MTKPVWVEQWLLDRLRKARDADELAAVAEDMLKLKIARYFDQLRIEIRAATRICGPVNPIDVDVLDHIQCQEELNKSRGHGNKRRAKGAGSTRGDQLIEGHKPGASPSGVSGDAWTN